MRTIENDQENEKISASEIPSASEKAILKSDKAHLQGEELAKEFIQKGKLSSNNTTLQYFVSDK